MDLAAVRDDVALMDLLLRDVGNRPIDTSNPDWQAALALTSPVGEAGVEVEATDALEALLGGYETGDEPTRHEIRQIFRTFTYFTWAARLPADWGSAAEFRRRLIHLSARDQGTDPRDELVELWSLCGRARELGIDVEPVLREVSTMSAGVDHYGAGPTRQLILRGTEQH